MRANERATMMRQPGRVTTARAAAKFADVERNAPGILHLLGRPKRIDVGEPDQLKRGGWGEGVEQHARGQLLAM